MAQQKDLLSRLADAGEDALKQLAKAPGGKNVLDALNTTRERLDELQKKVRGIDALEKRVAALERQVQSLSKSGAKAASPRKPAARNKPAARKPAA
jgi:hypothetical protein